MGAKRKPKENSKKVEDNKSKNQAILSHYFPNLCQNKSKTYQNILNKPNGAFKE